MFDTSKVHTKGTRDGTKGNSNKKAIEEADYEQCLKVLKNSGWEFHLKPSEQRALECGKVPKLCIEKLNAAFLVSRDMCTVISGMMIGCCIV